MPRQQHAHFVGANGFANKQRTKQTKRQAKHYLSRHVDWCMCIYLCVFIAKLNMQSNVAHVGINESSLGLRFSIFENCDLF